MNGSRRKLDRTYNTPIVVCDCGSIPRIGIEAATAAGQLPYPSRTRKISPPAFQRVLEYESLWEN